jgi:hydroxymethylbilane synthase
VVSSSLVRIASRGSELALWQAGTVRDRLLEAHVGLEVEIQVIRTTGDRILDVPLARIGDRGLFTKEIDEALLDGRADIAVHSLKDVPTRVPEGLTIAAVTERADPRDVLIGPEGVERTLDRLPPGARIGTSSLRRRAQLRHRRPDLEIVDLRGNLNTRLAKLDEGAYDAIVLAAAGVERLGWSARISEYLDPPDWLPAVGQGALAIVAPAAQSPLLELLAPLHHPPTASCVAAERAFLRALEGGCQVPIGALAEITAERLAVHGLVADLDGHQILRGEIEGLSEEADRLGDSLAESLLSRGAGQILRAIREDAPAPGIPGP